MGQGNGDNRWDFHRSVSQRRLYRECGKKYLLRYGAGWRQKTLKAQYQFGSTCEEVCNAVVRRDIETPEQAGVLFVKLWEEHRMNPKLTYRQNLSWRKLADRGERVVQLACTWIQDHLALEAPLALQRRINFQVGSSKELAILDFVGWGREGTSQLCKPGILDFKTGDRNEPEHLGERDEQLTSYQVAVESDPELQQMLLYSPGGVRRGGVHDPIEWLALLRMVWTTEPKLQVLWYPARTEEEKAEYRLSAQLIDRQIRDGIFLPNERACHNYGGCWAQPLCFQSQKHRLDELERDERKVEELIGSEAEVEW